MITIENRNWSLLAMQLQRLSVIRGLPGIQGLVFPQNTAFVGNALAVLVR
jgi:hypothetical protein